VCTHCFVLRTYQEKEAGQELDLVAGSQGVLHVTKNCPFLHQNKEWAWSSKMQLSCLAFIIQTPLTLTVDLNDPDVLLKFPDLLLQNLDLFNELQVVWVRWLFAWFSTLQSKHAWEFLFVFCAWLHCFWFVLPIVFCNHDKAVANCGKACINAQGKQEVCGRSDCISMTHMTWRLWLLGETQTGWFSWGGSMFVHA